ncbi:MAG TPA: DNA-processing protein DprA, partial [Polyangiaceae bacterium]|nr:DNA-processing protein DprA [Polyangiaceae bacterium]
MSEVADRCLTGSALPGRLADLDEPPERLFLRGELPRGPAVAIVGTRKPTPEYVKFARELAG